ncbi:GntR family transcriptional regulator [Crateriforma conspicua]|uniref:Putative HTH-type transcriptional regulator YdfH n=1 Tax=Crateriforma conspicua TaxID=2527996 RepID=A0A5C5XZI5_9PLAN|nr:GntR family transcriptional regulator [Crateriforma conspicua]QDV62448.1 putative HTH-type transcriptional regulator YdfH [Crateriforma conspicua]TWT68856.1 putative HTH-type transcriptional regulator YdfH [Crateriforma conspicua]
METAASKSLAPTASDRVFAVLKSRILSAEYSPGQPLTELGVADDLKVSRTPIREALRRLEHEHLVQILPRKGAIVVGISAEDINEAYLIRQALEGISARRAAELLSDSALAHLQERMAVASAMLADGDRAGASDATDELHRVVLSVGGTPRLLRMVANLKELTERLHELALLVPNRLERSIEQHQEVLEALKLRDGEEAERRMREHIASTLTDVLAAFRNRQVGTAGSVSTASD